MTDEIPGWSEVLSSLRKGEVADPMTEFGRRFSMLSAALLTPPQVAVIGLGVPEGVQLPPSLATLAASIQSLTRNHGTHLFDAMLNSVISWVRGSWDETGHHEWEEGEPGKPLPPVWTVLDDLPQEAVTPGLATLITFLAVVRDWAHLATEGGHGHATVDGTESGFLITDFATLLQRHMEYLDEHLWPLQAGRRALPDDDRVPRCRRCGERSWFLWYDAKDGATPGTGTCRPCTDAEGR